MGELPAIGEDRRQVMDISGGKLRSGLVIQALIACATLIVPHLIDKSILPTTLELREIGIRQNGALGVLATRVDSRIPTRFGRDALYTRQLLVAVAFVGAGPGKSVISIEPVPTAVERGLGGVPGLVVAILVTVSADIVVRIHIVGEAGFVGKDRLRAYGDCQELQTDIVGFRPGFGGAEDRIALENQITLHGGIQVLLVQRHRNPTLALSAAALAVVENWKIVDLVRSLQLEKRVRFRECSSVVQEV